MPDYPVSANDLGTYCPPTWQEALTAFASKMYITIPPINGVVIQQATPSVSDQDKLWIKTDGSSPYVLGALVYQGGSWRYIPGPPTYFADSSGSPNVITLTTGESMTTTATLANRIFVVRTANANTGAVTITVDSIGAKDLRKNNNDAFVGGELEAGMLILVYYDSVAGYFQVVNTLNEAATERVKAAVIKTVKSAATDGQQVFVSSPNPVTVELTTIEDPGSLVTSFSSNQFVLPAGTYLVEVVIPVWRSSGDVAMQGIIYNVTDGVNVATGKVVMEGDMDHSYAHVKTVFTISSSKTYDIRVHANQAYADVYLGGAAMGNADVGGLSEVYTQVSIVKLA